MSRRTRYIFDRVLVGLLIGIGMFYFRSAHAQTCYEPTAPNTIRVSAYSNNVSANPIYYASVPALNSTWPSHQAVIDAVRAAAPPPLQCSTGTATSKWENGTGSATSVKAICSINRGEMAFITAAVAASCPSGKTLTNGQCCGTDPSICPAGQHYNGTQCVADVCPAAGTKDSIIVSGTPPASYCLAQPDGSKCLVNVEIGMEITATGSSTWSERKFSGGSCPTADATPPTAPTPIATPAGSFQPDAAGSGTGIGCGYYNGVRTCMGQPPADGRCRITPNGGAVCVTSTDPSKPAAVLVDNGTPGRPATPQATASSTPTGATSPSTTAAIYSPSQVAASSNYNGTGASPSEEGEGEGADTSFSDTPFLDLPSLYEQKYESGLVGVWNEKKPALMGSGFMQSVSASFPTIAGGGECPTWSMNLNFGQHANFGTQAIQVPCFVWNAIALIFLVTSCFTARRIIFGG